MLQYLANQGALHVASPSSPSPAASPSGSMVGSPTGSLGSPSPSPASARASLGTGAPLPWVAALPPPRPLPGVKPRLRLVLDAKAPSGGADVYYKDVLKHM